MEDILINIGISPDNISWSARIAIALAVILAGGIIDTFARKVIIPIIDKATAATATKWDDYILSKKVLHTLCHLIYPVLLFFFMPLILKGESTWCFYTQKFIEITIIIISIQFLCAILEGFYLATAHETSRQNDPLHGLLQMGKLIVIGMGTILIISTLIDRNPLVILTGLGASAAVLMLVFKDTILGLVAGVQLSVNDMLKVGDWITIPSRNVNGNVVGVSLTTVKVRNFDNTIVTIPPYSRISDSFQNWRGMIDSRGRRIMRSINIDMNTVRFCSPEEIEKYRRKGWIDDNALADTVNLKVFRNYMVEYLSHHPGVKIDSDSKMFVMVRQLQPTPHGLPVELYFFTSTTEWITYEAIQSEIFDHTIAIAHEFGLRIFQSPAGTDLRDMNITTTSLQS